tara:strand:+ start:531 stop:1640 length:1110 start_codon:yes stop_codon:yes gene_type:complete
MTQTLKNLVSLYQSKVDDDMKESLMDMKILDDAPKGLYHFTQAMQNLQPQKGETIHAMVEVGDVFGDPTYNRVNRVHYGNIASNLKKRGGFSYKSAGTISLFLRPDGTLVATKGNHRVTKMYAVTGDKKALIPAEITIHPSEDAAEIIRLEAEDHNVDCNYRTSQATDDRFKAAFHAGEKWAVDLYNYLSDFSVGIAGTNEDAEYEVTSYRQITKSMKISEAACSRYINAFTLMNCEDELGGIAVYAGTCFLVNFAESIEYVDSNNNVDSFTGLMDYIYNNRNQVSMGFLENATQAELTKGNGKFKGEEVNVARLVSLYNEYCQKILRAKIPTLNNTAIGYSSNEYLDFVKKADETVRSRVDEIARQTF